MITRIKDKSENLCDYCRGSIADCCGNVQFNEVDPATDNIIACDDFHGTFDPETMTQESAERSRG